MDALKDAMKTLATILEKQSESQAPKVKEPLVLQHPKLQLPLYDGTGSIDLFCSKYESSCTMSQRGKIPWLFPSWKGKLMTGMLG